MAAPFWIKLTNDFINSKQFKRLEKRENGHSYALLLIHLLSDTKPTGGVFLDDLGSEWVPLDAESIHDEHPSFSIDFIESALEVFCNMGYITWTDEGFYTFVNYDELINTHAAAKQQRYRDRLKARESNESGNNVTNNVNNDDGNNVTEIVTDS